MYSKIGMFNLDPNNDNYMQLQGKIVQIDYGANRFQNVDAFEMFFNQLGTFFPRDSAMKLLLNGTAQYPPTYYMYRYIFSPAVELSKENFLSKDIILLKFINIIPMAGPGNNLVQVFAT